MDNLKAFLVSYAETIIETISLLVALITFVISARMDRKATEEQTHRDTVRATLQDFGELRRLNQSFPQGIDTMNSVERNQAIKQYVADLERFAAGCNMGAYDVEVVNKMSGGSLIANYRKYFKTYIEKARRNLSPKSPIKVQSMYNELESMIKSICELRNESFEPVEDYPEDRRILERFLTLPLSSTGPVFDIFRTLPNVQEDHANGKKGYLYVPGIRADRCVLVAHADTYFDSEYMGGEVFTNDVILDKDVYRGKSNTVSIGADDRSGCAILWLLRTSGHSLLILDGEEHGQAGANYLVQSNPELFRELNEHTFMLEFDRRGSNDYRYYNIPVTSEFARYIEDETGYNLVEGKGKTDIVVLCEKTCGANLSVGYYGEHKPEEHIVISEWEKTLQTARRMLNKPLKKYPIESITAKDS